MAKYQLLLPKMGESVAEATIIKWLKNPGDYIEADEAVMEIATDKVDSEVPSPVSGRLIEQRCKDDDVVQVGSVIAIIETDTAEQAAPAPQSAASPQPAPVPQQSYQPPVAAAPPQQNIPGTEQLEQRNQAPVAQQNAGELKSESRFYSPLVKHIALQENISINELDRITGSGAEGRLTKDDLLNYIRNKTAGGPPVTPRPQVQQQSVKIGQPEPSKPAIESGKQAPATSTSGVDEIIEMDRMRRLIADHMVMSKHTSPHVTSFIEADVTGLVLWREKIKNSFEKREGEKITFTPIFIEAVVKAIKDYPMINVSVNGTQIIKKAAINISMATALPNGNLIVPVIKKADELNLLGITKAVNSLANKARTGKLQPDDVKDGTFTITNVGTFGNVMGTPIINQPQVAILAVGAIKKKPAVIETAEGDVIAIRHMMFLSLSYDHRVVDGALGGSFLRRIGDYLENWDTDKEV
ncbi:dihydrolipoamide acetyltransferase family protein [Mucilaginibacter sp.]|uniref:dihydrolipoamide acetyltransferase family protein n=1 Tax=Mucilaginibacter sp. TaxID=1882438 RepID=UPI0026113DD1|nr:dihydrolipoamide acetyltransferase family protein [Mucilaginibacter sp.]MDB5032389.1 2-oxo acid dehydrogenase subunit [Mucilaginibacter sp.]